MPRAKHLAFGLALAAPFFLNGAAAQQPTPGQIVVQAANTATNPSRPDVAKPAAPDSSSSLQAAIKSLEKTQAVNDEILKKQEATLAQLDELQKAAEQLKIFAKRG